jgi:hypothetical protein
MINMIIVGHLASDVVLRKSIDNQSYTILRIASDRHYRDKSGKRHTDYVSAKVRGRLAEICEKYCYRGCLMAVAGDFELIPRDDQPECETGFLLKARSMDFLFPMVEQVRKHIAELKPDDPEDTGVFQAIPIEAAENLVPGEECH